MGRKIAILRGINVGGKRKILMADLKAMFLDMGFTDVTTYIQSGNVFFKDDEIKQEEIEEKIESAIKGKFGYDVPVIVRTSSEIAQALESNPFYGPDEDIKALHLTFLKSSPSKEHLKSIEDLDFAPDRFVVKNKNVFLFCPGKYHQTKLSNQFFEKKLKVGATTRNWKTVLKLMALSKQ